MNRTTTALAVIGGVSLAPAFVLPRPASTQTQLRGTSQIHAEQVKQPSFVISSEPSCTVGVLGLAAAVSLVAGAKKQVSRSTLVSCSAFEPSSQVGATPPFGFFDPAGFCRDVDEKKFNQLRSAEIKHGRAAMMASLGLAVQSVYKLPGYENVPSGLAAQWSEPGSNTLIVVFFLIGCLEIGLSPWKEDPSKPGDYGDPLNLGNASTEMRNKELNNGRMAMFATLGIISAELYTGATGVTQFAVGQSKTFANRPGFCGVTRRAELSARKAFDGAAQAGASAPLGYFDPLKLSQTQERFDKFRASEVKHGRVAMLAILGAIAAHWGHAYGAENVPAGMAGFSDPAGAKGVIAMTLAAAFLELGPWADGFAKEPGNFGDPAGLGLDFGSNAKDIKTKELNNGRLAMMATIGLIAQELTTGEKVSDLPAVLGF
jgi:hypothetical protein